MYIPILLSIGLSLFTATDSLRLHPDPPFAEIPVVLVSSYENRQSPTGESSAYTWEVNEETVKTGTCPNTFRLSFEQGFQPDDGNDVLDSLGAQIVAGRFGNAVHIGLESSRLA